MNEENDIFNKINIICDEAKEYEEMRIFNLALKKYNQALELLEQKPKDAYNQLNILIKISIGDVLFCEKKYSEAKSWYYRAKECVLGLNNAYILFLIGKCFYEENNMAKAKDYFIKTYMLSGIDIFCTENIKYYNLIEGLL